jgi:outer membrane protein assembly factor BamB/predicted phosphodiesterase
VRALLVSLALALAAPASAATIHGLVYDDANGDGVPSEGERGVGNAVVAFGTQGFVTTDANGQFDLAVADDARGIVWARVPDGFVPGPAWTRWLGSGEVDIALHRLKAPVVGALTFVVASDTHIGIPEPGLDAPDLARAARRATSLDPPPAFFTILGDVTQGGRPEQYDVVDRGLADLDVPYIPVPGNHDWYDGGAAWFAHYGPDNYSFDLGGVHFIVWNMALPSEELRAYLGAELRRVPATMPIVALTHDPPHDEQIDVLRELGVDYVLTGHTHTNRVVDHRGFIELNTEPMLMGGLDFTPAGYRVVTIDHGRMTSYHRTVVDQPFLALVAPATDRCIPASPTELLVASEIAAGASLVSARIDCASRFELRHAGGWVWRANLPALSRGDHMLELDARGSDGRHATRTMTLHVCAAPPASPARPGPDWPQVGGSAAHAGSVAERIEPPIATRWTRALGGHVLTSAPIIAGGVVYVATTDLADGDTGGVTAVDLATGAIRWRARTKKPIRGGLAFVDGLVVTTQIDGNVLAFDAQTGAVRWQRAMSTGFAPQAGAVFSPPTVLGDVVFVGHQRAIAALSAHDGAVRWHDDPIPEGRFSQSAAAIGIGHGLAVGTFHHEAGGVIAWDASTGERRWSYVNLTTVAIEAAPVIGENAVYIVSGATEVTALDFRGTPRWQVKLDPQGFEWGSASIGTPALAAGALIVPTMYGDLVALDAATGKERWRHHGSVGPLRTTHYRGSGQASFAASPVVTGDLVWVADAAGILSALDIATGTPRASTALGTPILAGLAASGDWLVVAGFDGTLRGLAPAPAEPHVPRTRPQRCEALSSVHGGTSAMGGWRWLLILAGALVVGGGAIWLLGRRRYSERDASSHFHRASESTMAARTARPNSESSSR